MVFWKNEGMTTHLRGLTIERWSITWQFWFKQPYTGAYLTQATSKKEQEQMVISPW